MSQEYNHITLPNRAVVGYKNLDEPRTQPHNTAQKGCSGVQNLDEPKVHPQNNFNRAVLDPGNGRNNQNITKGHHSTWGP